MSLLRFCQWLADTPGSIALHESTWGYPVVEWVHALTMCVLLGLAVMLDLRALGLTMRRVLVKAAPRLLGRQGQLNLRGRYNQLGGE